jgi:3-dehydroquinate synthase
MKTLTVDLGERAYPIHIGKGLLEQIHDLVPISFEGRKVFILYDKSTYPYAQIIEEVLAGKCADTKMHGIEGGEQTKSYDGYERVLGWILDQKVSRQDVLMAVGGGVVGDLGGFVAATVLRGISFVQVPTTLLAQVDSSVGGKTGINTPQGKNLVGAFYQPQAVLCGIGTLATLPEREMQAGYAEIVKYGLINDEAFFEWLEENGEKILALEPEALTYAIEKSCANKAAVVAADEKESGQRALLNLGHTFGHALEAAAGYDGRLLHGEAVAIGMILAHDLSARMGLCSQEVPSRIATHFKSIGLKTKIEEIKPVLKQSAEEIVQLMAGDKKATGDGRIGFILSKGIGEAFQTQDVNMDDVVSVVQESLEG